MLCFRFHKLKNPTLDIATPETNPTGGGGGEGDERGSEGENEGC